MIQRDGQHYLLGAEQVVPGTLDDVFAFFSNPENLARITPQAMRFEILTPLPIEMKPGTVIDYRIRVRGVPLKWRTLITDWSPPHRFIDEQTRGPYCVWIHEHTFEPHGNGQTLMRDRVRFLSRGPKPLAHLLHRLVVNRDVQRVFEHRQRVLQQVFTSPHQE